jgi:hypothetical protein
MALGRGGGPTDVSCEKVSAAMVLRECPLGSEAYTGCAVVYAPGFMPCADGRGAISRSATDSVIVSNDPAAAFACRLRASTIRT